VKFKLDENLPKLIHTTLIGLGHDSRFAYSLNALSTVKAGPSLSPFLSQPRDAVAFGQSASRLRSIDAKWVATEAASRVAPHTYS